MSFKLGLFYFLLWGAFVFLRYSYLIGTVKDVGDQYCSQAIPEAAITLVLISNIASVLMALFFYQIIIADDITSLRGAQNLTLIFYVASIFIDFCSIFLFCGSWICLILNIFNGLMTSGAAYYGLCK